MIIKTIFFLLFIGLIFSFGNGQTTMDPSSSDSSSSEMTSSSEETSSSEMTSSSEETSSSEATSEETSSSDATSEDTSSSEVSSSSSSVETTTESMSSTEESSSSSVTSESTSSSANQTESTETSSSTTTETTEETTDGTCTADALVNVGQSETISLASGEYYYVYTQASSTTSTTRSILIDATSGTAGIKGPYTECTPMVTSSSTCIELETNQDDKHFTISTSSSFSGTVSVVRGPCEDENTSTTLLLTMTLALIALLQ
eukprot:TRINITY_DN763_c0_g1_i1.p1 TRINITY_DN763_c0_g1~~TRINITY_DN763_c0_g1_i1.p1  ORF type:complete len:260 (+),score=50.65 TRINITY_DN763_c0_g1_i1:43-822(+)